MAKNVTIHDVARRAGVSHTTVSWVIHDDPRITDKTKKKVAEAIKELNYHPNVLARNLVKGKSNIIALVAAFFSSAFEIEIMKGIEISLTRRNSNYGFTNFATRSLPERKKQIFEQILYGRRADAVISLNVPINQELHDECRRLGIPLVLVEMSSEQSHYIKTDNFFGAYEATKHLMDKGRKKIALINGDEGDEGGQSPVERHQGYIKALEDGGLEVDDSLIHTIDYYYFEEGEALVEPLLEKGVDGVFCAAGDMVAMGILHGLKRRGLTAPDAFSLVGYDDLMPSSLISPSLTTIQQPLQQLGEQALNFCFEALESKEVESYHSAVLKPRLVVRESS